MSVDLNVQVELVARFKVRWLSHYLTSFVTRRFGYVARQEICKS